MEIGLRIEFWIHFEAQVRFSEFGHSVEGEDTEVAVLPVAFSKQIPSLVEEFQAIGFDERCVWDGVAEFLVSHLERVMVLYGVDDSLEML